ncbi:amidohydrolase family protein [Oceanomicrobium pacificus]|uniref:Amidohydrolase family protein n=1 Tax=Oceanomicrobium pacificus TaxID=2692916 RepID=A0A6B0TZQ9_9RHOB|nr:amidohydrolase [Oceanomicrobium pacificus]MXU66888.1 amidohydrolase family protein [Oceanomicrobium pacificus]
MLLDTHLHLIYRDKLSYPWLAGFQALNKDNRFDAYTRDAARLGIMGCLHMEVDVAEAEIDAETELVAALMAQPDTLMRGAISSCRPESAEFPAFLERCLANPVVKGLRRVLHVVPDDLSTTDRFRENVRRLSGTRLTFDLCVLPHQHGIAAELVDHCPDVTFILDHCGVPDIAGRNFLPWQNGIRKIADRPNVIAKISGVVAYGDADIWGLNDIRPYVDETVAAFGHGRIVWGSDQPVCNLGGGIATWVAATHALTEGWSAADRAALYQENACRIWSL